MGIDKQTDVDGPAIGFRLDQGSGVPTYLQLVQQVEQSLRLGYLRRGDQLPTVKDVVESLAINPNTVLKAYRELEHRGLAVGRPGQGTFIDGTLRHVGIAEQEALRRALADWLRSAEAAGLDEDGVVALFASVMRDFPERPGTRASSRAPSRAPSRGRAGARTPRSHGSSGNVA
jgi:DNA-binding transcriptional regulator YhcF (GntR family)